MNLSQVVLDYGQRIGRTDLALPLRGPAVVSSDEGISVLIEADEKHLLLYALVPAPYASAQDLMVMLQSSDLRRQPPHAWPVQVGGRGQGADFMLMLLVRIPERQASAQTLEHALAWLMQWKQEHVQLGSTR
jgi:hypothetical protein